LIPPPAPDRFRRVDLFAYIGETLRRIRKERGQTLDDLGKEAGLGRGQLSRIENGRQEATLSTLSKLLVAQGVSRREFFRRYELVEAEIEERAVTGGLSLADDRDPWPEEVRLALKRVESFVSAAFLQPRLAQGTIELGDVVILFRIVAKNPPEKAEESTEEPPSAPAPPRKSRPSPKRPARRRKTR
jgi:transcriptional regulator with XRE-family HTH domain